MSKDELIINLIQLSNHLSKALMTLYNNYQFDILENQELMNRFIPDVKMFLDISNKIAKEAGIEDTEIISLNDYLNMEWLNKGND